MQIAHKPAGVAPAEPQAPLSHAPVADERYLVPGLRNGLAVLGAFSRDRPAMGLSDIARAVGMTRSSAYRLVYTLEIMGFLRREPDGRRYRLGSQVLGLGFAYLGSIDLIEIARPVLEQLRDETGNATQLAVLEDADIVYLARASAIRPLTSTVMVGTRLPAHATAMGRVLLMEKPASDIHALLDGRPLDRFTENTATTLADLQRQLAQDRACGHVVSHANFEAGVDSIALPVRDDRGQICAAISMVGHGWNFADATWLRGLVEAGQRASLSISTWLGYRPELRPAPSGAP